MTADPTKKTPGQIAFEAWCSSPDTLIAPAHLQTAWDKCGDVTKDSWERVGRTLIAVTAADGRKP